MAYALLSACSNRSRVVFNFCLDVLDVNVLKVNVFNFNVFNFNVFNFNVYNLTAFSQPFLNAKRSRLALLCYTFLALSILPSVVHASDESKLKMRWVSAITADNTSTLKTLLEEFDEQTLWSLGSSNGKTALMVACKVGDERFAKELVRLGADIKRRTATDGTAFMFALLGNQQNLAQWLVGLGADINAQGSNGWTGAMIASAKGFDKTLEWLVSIGANPQTPDVYGFSPLMRAADNGHTDAVKVLVANDEVDIHWQDELDNTALHYAVSGNYVEITRLLIAAGAASSTKNALDLSPLDILTNAINDPTATKAQKGKLETLLQLLE